jgi:hypothetical protein
MVRDAARPPQLHSAQIKFVEADALHAETLPAALKGIDVAYHPPVPPAVSRPLIEGLRSESVCTTVLAARLFPSIRPVSYSAAVQRALERPAPLMPLPSMDGASQRTVRAEGIICDMRETTVDAPPERVFELIGNVGGKNGWFYANFCGLCAVGSIDSSAAWA